MTIYSEEWMKKEYTCSSCSWSGTGGDSARGLLYREKFIELTCPTCSASLDVLILPAEKGCAHSLEGLSEEQLKAKADAAEQERQYREKCLTSADQLPDSAGWRDNPQLGHGTGPNPDTKRRGRYLERTRNLRGI